MSLRRFVCLSLAVAMTFVGFTGCAKKKTPEPVAPAVTEAPKDTGDVFQEFFQDDPKSAAASAKSAPAAFTGFVEDGRYVVQISCVGSQALAQSVVSTLEAKGWPAYIAEVENPTPELPGTYYRVRVGGFTGVSAAKSFGEETLVPSGYDFWVDNRSNDNVGVSSYGLGSDAPATSSYGTSTSSSSEGSSWGTSSSTTPASSSTSSGSDWGSSSSSGTTATSSTDWSSSSSTTTSTPSATTTTTTTTTSTPAAGGSDTTATTGTGTSSGTGTSGTGTTGSGIGGDDWGSDW